MTTPDQSTTLAVLRCARLRKGVITLEFLNASHAGVRIEMEDEHARTLINRLNLSLHGVTSASPLPGNLSAQTAPRPAPDGASLDRAAAVSGLPDDADRAAGNAGQGDITAHYPENYRENQGNSNG